MNINDTVITCLAPTGILVVPDEKTADDKIYYVFNYTSVGDAYGDDGPQLERYLVQVHLCCPANTNTRALRQQTKQLLFAAGFTFPTVSNASNEDGQQWVFECELAMEVL